MGLIRKSVGDTHHPAAEDETPAFAPIAELSPASRPSWEPPFVRGSTMPRVSLHWHSTLLSAVAGYVDAAGFALLLGLFPAHLTGELVADVIAISSGHLAAHTHLWSFPVFVGAVALATLVARLFRHYGLQARAGLLALVTLALFLFSASDALPWLVPGVRLPVVVRGGFAVAAMGFQSALMRESLTGSCPTTVMTGNLTQAVIEIVDRLLSKLTRPLLAERRTSAARAPVVRVFLVFMFSAALGGWLTRAYGSLSVTLPALVTAVLTIQALHEDFARRALPIAPTTAFESESLWPDVFVAPARVTSAAEALACDPLREGASGDCSSATRIKAAARNAAPVPPQCRVSGIQRRFR